MRFSRYKRVEYNMSIDCDSDWVKRKREVTGGQSISEISIRLVSVEVFVFTDALWLL